MKKSFELQDGLKLHFIAAMISGLVTTIASMPVDIVKTRLQNQKVFFRTKNLTSSITIIDDLTWKRTLPLIFIKFIDGKPEYKGVVDVFTRVIKHEGFFSLWKGFLPYYFRLGPHTVLTFIFVEQCKRLYIQSQSN